MPRRPDWILGNEEDGVPLWVLPLFSLAFTRDLPRLARVAPWWHCFELGQGHMRWLLPGAHSRQIGQQLLKRLLRRPGGAASLRCQLVRSADRLSEFSKELERADPAIWTDRQLTNYFQRHEQLVRRMLGYGMISTLAEFPDSQFTAHLTALLDEKARQRRLPEAPAEYFAALTSIPERSAQQQAAQDLGRIASAVRRSQTLRRALVKGNAAAERALRARPVLWRHLQRHLGQSAWVNYGYAGPLIDLPHLLNELRELLSADCLLNAKTLTAKVLARRIRNAERALGLNAYERQIFSAMRDTVFMKLYRKDAITRSFAAMEPVLRELARRSGVVSSRCSNLLPGEHQALLRGDRRLRRALTERSRYCAFACESSRPRLLLGAAARRYIAQRYQPEQIGNVQELTGQTGCPGKAVGLARIINVPADMAKMETGDVLVSIATTPDIVSVMRKAAAIVTEQGGITSHAAIVSRELNIPCVIGTKIATKVLKDGDRVEVDATKGLVKVVGQSSDRSKK